MKRTTLAALVLGGTIALAYSAGPLYNAITPVDPFVPVPGTTFDAYQVELELSPSPATLVAVSAIPSPISAPSPKAKVQTDEEPEPEPAKSTNSWIEITPDPQNPENGQGRYVGPTRSPGH